MAKASRLSKVLGGDNVSAALDRIEAFAGAGAQQLDKDHGVVKSAYDAIRAELEEQDEVHEKELSSLRAELGQVTAKLTAELRSVTQHRDQLVSKLSLVAADINRPLTDGSRPDGK